jgi:hypothetical protein
LAGHKYPDARQVRPDGENCEREKVLLTVQLQ